MFQMLQSWWYSNFTLKVTTLLDTAGLCVLVIVCLLYRFEKMLFDYHCYGAVYDASIISCLCVSFLLPSLCRPTYSYQSRQRHQPQRCWSSGLSFSYRLRPQDYRRNKSGIHNRRKQYRYFRNKYNRADRACACSNLGSSGEEPKPLQTNTQRLIQAHHQVSVPFFPLVFATVHFSSSVLVYTIAPKPNIGHGNKNVVDNSLHALVI